MIVICPDSGFTSLPSPGSKYFWKGSEVFKNSANFASSPGSDTKIAWKWMEHWWTWMFIPSNLVSKVLTHHDNTYREANEPMRPMSIFHFLTNDMTCATICVLVAPHSHTALSAKSARNSAVSGFVNSRSFQSSSTKKWIETWKQLEFPKKIVPVCPSCPWWGWRVRRPARWVRIGLESWRWDLLRCDLAICFETVRLCSEDIGMCLCLDMSKKTESDTKPLGCWNAQRMSSFLSLAIGAVVAAFFCVRTSSSHLQFDPARTGNLLRRAWLEAGWCLTVNWFVSSWGSHLWDKPRIGHLPSRST